MKTYDFHYSVHEVDGKLFKLIECSTWRRLNVQVIDTTPDTYTVACGGDNYYQISSPDNSTFVWGLYSINGEKIRAGRAVNTQDLWLNDVPIGIYMIKVRGKCGSINQKIVKVQ